MPEPQVNQGAQGNEVVENSSTQVVNKVEPKVEATQQPEQTIVSRAAAFKPQDTGNQTQTQTQDAVKFDINEINGIQDPGEREIVMKAYKSMQADYTRKTQEVSSLRKYLEGQKNEPSNWTPEKVQSLLSNQDFVQAAQAVAGATNQDDSYLSDTDKQTFNKLQNQVTTVSKQNQTLLKQQEDGNLATKYANYNPTQVDNIYNGMMTGQIQATREHLWKVQDYDDAVQRAYSLGRQDERAGTGDKVNAASFQGNNAVDSNDGPPLEPGMSKSQIWQTIKDFRLRNANQK